MSLISNIKNILALTSILFLLTACGGGGSSTPSTVAENSDTSAISTTEPTPTPIPSLTSEPEPKIPETISTPLLKITSIEEHQTTDVSTTIIKWELTEKAAGYIEYGIDTSYGNVTVPEESFDYAKHTQRLTDLESNTIYHYRIISEDADGNRVISEDRIFKTKSDGTVLSEPTTVLEQEPSTNIPAPTKVLTTAPDGFTVITGLQSGNTREIASANSAVFNNAFEGGNKNLVIPSGTWYTRETIRPQANSVITFAEGAKVQQLASAFTSSEIASEYAVMRIDRPNVTLNNPHLSQKGRAIDHAKNGTHAVLTIYGSTNTGNTTINGGILEWGAHNNFQGGRDNTVFNGTIFRDSGEHLVYSSGIRNGSLCDGLIFNNCIFERPGNGTDKVDVEANHLQLRNFKNVELNNCIVRGERKTAFTQYALMLTNIKGLTVNDTTFSDFSYFIVSRYDSRIPNSYCSGIELNNVTATPEAGRYNTRLYKNLSQDPIIFNNLTFTRPSRAWSGEAVFNDSTFVLDGGSYINLTNNARPTFNNCTWDASGSTTNEALNVDSGSTTFIGTQTKIAPTGGQSFNWSPLN